MPTVEVFVALYQSMAFKHWSLFVDGNPTKYHSQGSERNFRFETRISNARELKTLHELFYLCDVKTSKIKNLDNIVKEIPVRNDNPAWNCQDYVMDLERQKVIDDTGEDYLKNKEELEAKTEGLVEAD